MSDNCFFQTLTRMTIFNFPLSRALIKDPLYPSITKVSQALYHTMLAYVITLVKTLPRIGTFANRALYVCFDSHSLIYEIQYFKDIAIDRSYTFSIIDTDLFKLQLLIPLLLMFTQIFFSFQ